MININFNLRNPKGKKSSVRIILRYGNDRFYYPIKERIEVKYWDSLNQCARKSMEGSMEFNERLKSVKRKIERSYRAFLNDNDLRVPDKEELIEVLDIAFEKSKSPIYSKFFSKYIEKYIENAKTRLNQKTGKPISKNTIKTYVTLQKHIVEFENKKLRAITFKAIDLDFYGDYTDFLIKEYSLSTNAIGKDIQIMKAILNEASERGVTINHSYKSSRFKVIREESDSIHLNEVEIQELYQLDLSKEKNYETVRDLFVIGCYTGLRYSDYSNIKPENFTGDGNIKIRTIKTNETVTIPVLPIVKEILNKYNNKLPKSISNQKTNEYLKEIGKKIESFKVIVGKEITKGGQRISLTKAKWEMITSHTARRSFATNFYLKGYPALTIMAITGHRTEKAFLKYIKVGQAGQVKYFKSIADKENQLKAI